MTNGMRPANENEAEFVTATIGGQLFGFPILRVRDVFAVHRLTQVPLAPPEVAGVVNLRGRIVTVVDLRALVGLPGARAATLPAAKHDPAAADDGVQQMAIGIDWDGESYGVLIDSVGDVLRLGDGTREMVPDNLDPAIHAIAVELHRLDERLLIVADIAQILGKAKNELAA